MKIYIRYAFFQTFKIFFIALLASTIGLVFFFVVKGSIELGSPIGLTLKLTPYLLPDSLSKTLPIAALLSATLFFSQMAGNNEIIALKSMGIAPWRILLPVWIFMIFVSLASVWLNDLSISWSRRQMAGVVLNNFETTILKTLRDKKCYTAPDSKFIIQVSDVEEDGTLINPSFSGLKGSFGGVAETARLEVDAKNEIVWARLTNAEIETGKVSALLPSNADFPIPLGEMFKAGYRADPSASQVDEALAKLDAQKETNRRRLATQAAFAFLRGDVAETTRPQWKERAEVESGLEWKRNRYRLTVPRIWASGFACFFFAWVGAPFAIWFNKADYTAAFFACFLPVLVVYYPLFMFGIEGAKNGSVPPEFAWLGNVALGVVGCYFLKKIH